MGCIEKLSSGCVKNFAPCISYEKDLPSCSKHKDANCVSLEDTTSEIYEYICNFKAALSTAGFDTEFCLTFETNSDGEITQREVNEAILQKVCELEIAVAALGGGSEIDMNNLDFSSCEFNLGSFVDTCGEEINSVCDLLQALVDTIVTQQSTIDTMNTTISSLQSQITSLDERVTILETA